MLNSFFQLNPCQNLRTIPDAQSFRALLPIGASLRNASIARALVITNETFESVSFENVRLSHAQFCSVTFRECRFEDSLLIGTRFDQCEFHDCHFLNCNTYKFQLRDVYIDPAAFEFAKLYRTSYANIGVYLYQQLFRNASNVHQAAFAAKADVEMRRWLRHQRRWELRRPKVTTSVMCRKMAEIVGNKMFDLAAKYGYGPARFLFVSAVLFALLGAVAFAAWAQFGMVRNGLSVPATRYGEALYYCMLLSTTLGFSDLMPSTPCGRAFAIFCAMFGIAWAGLFTSILVRRIIR